MTLGQKLKKLRIEKGLTQKDLADQLHVTFQTVSKWENDENEPDISTLKEFAKLYDCSIDDLLNEDEQEEVKEEPPVVVKEEKPQQVVNKTIIIHHKEMHVCARCGKDIPESELVSEDVTKKIRTGRTTRSVSVGQTYYHRACFDEVQQIRAAAKDKAKRDLASHSKKVCFGWSIAGGVIALIISLLIFLAIPSVRAEVHPALGVLFSVLAGYGIFTMIYCILSGSYIGEVFLWCAKLTIRFPGLIFSWSLEGFAWLIGMKILFAAIGFIVGVLTFLLAVAVSAGLSIVSFPFVLIHNIRTDYEDAL